MGEIHNIDVEALKTKILERINKYERTCMEEMTRENAHTLTYGDKIAAVGNINALVFVMKELDPGFEYKNPDVLKFLV